MCVCEQNSGNIEQNIVNNTLLKTTSENVETMTKVACNTGWKNKTKIKINTMQSACRIIILHRLNKISW